MSPAFVSMLVDDGDSGSFQYVCHLADWPRWFLDLNGLILSARLVGSLV